jgi:hypothetical protein
MPCRFSHKLGPKRTRPSLDPKTQELPRPDAPPHTIGLDRQNKCRNNHRTDGDNDMLGNKRWEETSRKLDGIAERIAKLDQLYQELVKVQSSSLQTLSELLDNQSQRVGDLDSQSKALAREFQRLSAELEPIVGERTFEIFNRDQHRLLRTVLDRLLNRERPSSNPAFLELLKQAGGGEISDSWWNKVLAHMLVEAASVPGAGEVFERQAHLKNYLSQLALRHRARYGVGSLEQDDALFLYWLVRQAKPRRIVQCGALNGGASAFLMLALAHNSPDATITIIDEPTVFNSQDPAWTTEGKIYGAFLPEGKTPAWMVPDQYLDRVKLVNGPPHSLLPKVIDEMASVDFFYYACDHDHKNMMGAFEAVRTKLSKGAVVVAVDMGWNASLWDFADSNDVPSYTFRGSIGVGFF